MPNISRINYVRLWKVGLFMAMYSSNDMSGIENICVSTSDLFDVDGNCCSRLGHDWRSEVTYFLEVDITVASPLPFIPSVFAETEVFWTPFEVFGLA